MVRKNKKEAHCTEKVCVFIISMLFMYELIENIDSLVIVSIISVNKNTYMFI